MTAFTTQPKAGQPTEYKRQYRFSEDQEGRFSGNRLDLELDNIARSISQIRQRLAMIQLDDGTLKELSDVSKLSKALINQIRALFANDAAEAKKFADQAQAAAQQLLGIHAGFERALAEVKDSANAAEISSRAALEATIAVKKLKQTVEDLSASALQDRAKSEQAAARAEEAARKTSFSYRTIKSIGPDEQFPIGLASPSENLKVGDHILSLDTGDFYQIAAVSGNMAVVGKSLGNFRGPPGEQGVPGPAGEKGPRGEMGQSPFATSFGQFLINSAGELTMQYVGFEKPAAFAINEDGRLEVKYGDD